MRRISGISPISGVPNEHRFPEEELPQPKIDAPLKTNEKNEQKKGRTTAISTTNLYINRGILT